MKIHDQFTASRNRRYLGTFRLVIFRVALVFSLPLPNGIQCPCRNTVSPERSSTGFLSGQAREYVAQASQIAETQGDKELTQACAYLQTQLRTHEGGDYATIHH